MFSPSMKKNITVAFNVEESAKIDSFMEFVRNRETSRLYGKAKIGKSTSMAAKYLFNSLIDKRNYVSIGIFTRCMIDLVKSTEDIRAVGNTLDSALESIHKGNSPKNDLGELFDSLKALLEFNTEIVDKFGQSFEVTED